MLEIRDIRVEDLSRGCATDNSAPEVSFSLRSDIPGTFLRNAVIQLGDRVFPCGEEQTGIVLDGLDLKPFTSYAFSIHAEDNHGNRASETSAFQTGRRSLPWEAKWITDKSCRIGKKESPVPMIFRKKFLIRKPMKRAFITSTAMGIYELELNGEKVGSEYFAPGFTSYKKNLQYQYHDVTAQLREDNDKNESYNVEITINCAAEAVTVQRIDDTHCNPKAEWVRLGKPDLLTPAQVVEIKRKTRLSEEPQEFTTNGNTTKLTVSLRTNDVILLTLT